MSKTVRVPVEPTREQELAGKHALKGASEEPEWSQARIVYAAMLAAAQQEQYTGFDRTASHNAGEYREFQQPSDVVRDVEELQGLLRDVCDDVVGYLNSLSAGSVYQQVLLGKLHRIDTYLKEKG